MSHQGDPVCCPFCLAIDPNMVGIEKATGKVCRNEYHCPVPNAHGDPFRICPYCDWREDERIEPPATWAVDWVTKGEPE